MEAPPDAIYPTPGGLRSDSQNQSSGSSSFSRLISQFAKTNKTNGATKTAANPLKRKAESDPLSVHQAGRPTGNLEAKRRRAVSTSCGSSTGSASPPMSHTILRRQLQDKSRRFKQNYAKYRNLHAFLAALNNPSRVSHLKAQSTHSDVKAC